MMTADLHLLTGAKGVKKRRRRDELQEYLEAIVFDLRNDNPGYLKLLNDPWQWWGATRAAQVSYTIPDSL